MTLATFDRRVQVTKYRALSGTERAVYQPGSDWEDPSWGQSSSVSLAKVSVFRRSARVLEHEWKLDSVTLHNNHAYPDDILNCGHTNDDIGLHLNDPISRNAIERWKIGPGRKKAWRAVPRLRFADKYGLRLSECSHQRNAITRSCSIPLQNSELISFITRAPISFGIPTVMLEHSMVDQFRNQMSPKPSAVKKFARRIGIRTSNMSRPRTRSKSMADRLIHSNGDDGVGVDNEEDDDDSFELGPSYGYLEGELFTGMGDAT